MRAASVIGCMLGICPAIPTSCYLVINL